MLDMKFVRSNHKLVKEQLLTRGVSSELLDKFFESEKNWRLNLQEVEELKAKRMKLDQSIEELKSLRDHSVKSMEDGSPSL